MTAEKIAKLVEEVERLRKYNSELAESDPAYATLRAEVERLTSRAGGECTGCVHYAKLVEEVERLNRQELHFGNLHEQEMERLRTENKRLRASVKLTRDSLISIADDCRTENKRLREALEKVCATYTCYEGNKAVSMFNIARAALSKGE